MCIIPAERCNRKGHSKRYAVDKGKSFDTFCPIGPFIETELKPDRLQIVTLERRD